MENELINHLKLCKLFSSLTEAVLKNITSKACLVEMGSNETLFYQNRPSDNIYILIEGEMVLTLTHDNQTKVLGHITPFEAIGEISALSGEPYSYTVKSLKSCKLLKINSKDFLEICHRYPAVMYAAVYPVISRSQNILHLMSREKMAQHIVLIPANDQVSKLDSFADYFLKAANNNPDVIVISDFTQEYKDENSLKNQIREIEINKKPSQKIIYLLKSPFSLLAKIVLLKADILYLIADHDAKPYIDDNIKMNHSLLGRLDKSLHLKSYPELILLHSDNIQKSHVVDWLKQEKFNLHHHVHLYNQKDYQRLLRFISGKAFGLVLGGGGTRGWAHLGAIKALHEANIPIDMIGGTSVGAIIGASYAMHQSYEETYQIFSTIFEASRHEVSLRSLTLPIVSLFDAKKFTDAQFNAFQELLIEDTRIPFFCTSSNLSNYEQCIHRTGLIWEKTRASSSIPGLIPPMVIDGELHLDGGLLNNLPVDVMRQMLGKNSTIIAVELNSYIVDKRRYQFPPVFTFKQALFAKMKKNLENYRFPRFIDIFMKGLLVGSAAKTHQNSLAADILVNVDLNKFRLLHANAKQAKKIVELGYLEMKKQLEQEK